MANNDSGLSVSELDEIVLNIFRFLGVSELLKAALVCKKWHRIANDMALWRSLVLRRWPSQKPVLRHVSTLALQWRKLYRNLSAKGSYSPDDMKYFVVCKVVDIDLDSDELRKAVLLRMEEVTSLWEKPGLYELEETSPRFFNSNMELYYDTHDLKWVFVDRRREYVDDSFTIRLNLDRMTSRRMRFIRPYQVMASCVMMYRWLFLFKHLFTEDVGLTFYRIWRFRLKHIKTGFIFETYDWKAAMSSTFTHGCPLAESFKDGGLSVLNMLSSPFFVMHPLGNHAYKIWYQILSPQASDVELSPRDISRSSSTDTLDSSRSGSDETESEENGDDSGYFCNCEYFIHRSSWEYEEQQIIQAESASQWEIIHTKPKSTFEVVFDSHDEKWLFYKHNQENIPYPRVLNQELVNRSLDSSVNVELDVSAFSQLNSNTHGTPLVDRYNDLASGILGQEALPSSLTLYRLVCLFDLNSVQYRNLDDTSVWSISLQHKLTRGTIQFKDLNGWLHVFVSFNEELKLYCNDLVMMSLNHQCFGFLHENKSQSTSFSEHKVGEMTNSNKQGEEAEGSEDDLVNPLEKFKNDICSLLHLLINQKFAHPYGTVAGAVA